MIEKSCKNCVHSIFNCAPSIDLREACSTCSRLSHFEATPTRSAPDELGVFGVHAPERCVAVTCHYRYDAPCDWCSDPQRWEPNTAPAQNPGMDGQYTFRGGVEPLEFISSNKMTFLEGNVIKYLYRHPFKGGLESLKKARFYLDQIIEGYNDNGPEE